MSILNKFKKITGREEKPQAPSKTAEKGKIAAAAGAKTKINDTAWRILRSPRISEKSAFLIGMNQYVFNVFPKANKLEIKRAVEKLYNVTVERVRVVNVPAKKRRLGRTEGFRKGLKTGYRKAIITLEKGQTIDIMPH